MFAELVILAAAALVALLLLIVHCCRPRKRPPSPTELLQGTSKERPLERLRRVLLRICSRRSRVEPAATSPDAQGEAISVQQQLPSVAGPEEEVAAWRDRWFGPPGSRELYTIEEESSTSSWTPTAVSEGDVESQCERDHHEEPETPFYTPATSPQHEAAAERRD